ncbi:MAG: transketolase [Chlamydiae bacterium]|nr:transketolase [Chlamydiota bacterium]
MEEEILSEIAGTIRGLSMDGVQKANSGHPGLPMGCAELGACLWADFLRYNPKNPDWFNRDRFVLSAGHGSMFLYSLLHLSGYDLTLDDLKSFRQLGSKTPGHPEKMDTPGVEVSTGPLGQGVANAVGMALSYKILENRFNRASFPIVSNKIVCLAGDGCLMEGVSSEASSLAGHLCLNNLILVYDMNYVTLDGDWKDSCSDDQVLRYKSYGWDVVVVKDGNDITEIQSVFQKLKKTMEKPTLVVLHTVIGKGAATKEGTHKVHGSPLGPEELKATKKKLDLPEEPFYVSSLVRDFFKKKQIECQKEEDEWQGLFDRWKKAYPDLYELYQKMENHAASDEVLEEIRKLPVEANMAGRKMSNVVLQALAEKLPYFLVGSADLSESDFTFLKNEKPIVPKDFSGKIVRYGIREFAMTAMANGISTTFLRPVVGTFFCFSDYARPAIRLGALSHHPTVLIYTHDSIGLGEDGPTHQPVEHLAALRAMPNLYVMRPGDANEVKGAYGFILKHQTGPTALVLTRQPLPTLQETDRSFAEGVMKGAYILIEEDRSKPADYILIGTGSELHLAVEVGKKLKGEGKNVRVVSMPCHRLFEDQGYDYKTYVLGGSLAKRVSIEAGVSFGWSKYIGPEGIAISIDEFGRSAPINDVMRYFGFTVDQIMERIRKGY